jgi:hypothetical protein
MIRNIFPLGVTVSQKDNNVAQTSEVLEKCGHRLLARAAH